MVQVPLLLFALHSGGFLCSEAHEAYLWTTLGLYIRISIHLQTEKLKYSMINTTEKCIILSSFYLDGQTESY